MKALITTTIHVPNNLADWRRDLNDDDVIIVAGDIKSPHTEIVQVLDRLPGRNVYLDPASQARWRSSTHIGWNCIQRRNIALLEALTYHPDIIFTVDDDNVPLDPEYHATRVAHLLTDGLTYAPTFATSVGWYNAAEGLGVHHRGFPHKFWGCELGVSQYDHDQSNIGVHASLWQGDPDIDAVERITKDPYVDVAPPHTFCLERGTWSPFNSQATAFRAELAPAMLMWPGVGRFDDIWASYVTQRVMDELGMVVAFGRPNVRQDRNPHDVYQDLSDETFGYARNMRVAELIRSAAIGDAISPIDMVQAIFIALTADHILPNSTIMTFPVWLDDVMEAMK